MKISTSVGISAAFCACSHIIGPVSGFSFVIAPSRQTMSPCHTLQRSFARTTSRTRQSSSTRLFASLELPPNEFSRIFNTDRISSYRRQANVRDYVLDIEANSEECEALAKRFEVKDLTQLSANVAIRPAVMGGSAGNAAPIQVEGTIQAHLTQTCVRTNEEFQVDVEFPINAIVRPVADSFWAAVQQQQIEAEENAPKKGKKNKKNPRRNNNVFQDVDMRDLESQLSFNIFMDDDDDTNNDNTIVEDEAIYALGSDSLDVGELVAQTFWLNLDPYPKKPGTDPMEITITG